jgi:hypothetical protein
MRLGNASGAKGLDNSALSTGQPVMGGAFGYSKAFCDFQEDSLASLSASESE